MDESKQPDGWDEKPEDEQVEAIKEAQAAGDLPVDEPSPDDAEPTLDEVVSEAKMTEPGGPDKNPFDGVEWARAGSSRGAGREEDYTAHIVESWTRAGVICIDGTTIMWPSTRPDLGDWRQCDNCTRIFFQRADL